jgi:hypothetical protein
MNNTQLLNQVHGPTEADVLAARKSPPAIPTEPERPRSSNAVPQTQLPHPPNANLAAAVR